MFVTLAERRSPPSEDDVTRLHRQTCAAVDELKAAGTSPERIVIQLKGLAADTGIQWTNRGLYDQLIGWCLAQYFKVPASEEK
jgi:hypothetical protein